MKKPTTPFFASRRSVEQVELGNELAPRFDDENLLPAIVINTADNSVLMLGYMNAEALELTLTTKQAHFWSRSREALWRKGEHSGFNQSVDRVLIDDDQDAVILYVTIAGPGSCHVVALSASSPLQSSSCGQSSFQGKPQVRLYGPLSVSWRRHWSRPFLR